MRTSFFLAVPIVILIVAAIAFLIQSSRIQRGISLNQIASHPTASPLPSPSSTSEFKIENPPLSSPVNKAFADWSYPGSTVVSSSDSKLVLNSQDDPTTITNWYKDKIRSNGMNSKSFVSTTNNGNILNKLAGAGNGQNILVEISRPVDQKVTKITVTPDT